MHSRVRKGRGRLMDYEKIQFSKRHKDYFLTVDRLESAIVVMLVLAMQSAMMLNLVTSRSDCSGLYALVHGTTQNFSLRLHFVARTIA